MELFYINALFLVILSFAFRHEIKFNDHWWLVLLWIASFFIPILNVVLFTIFASIVVIVSIHNIVLV